MYANLPFSDSGIDPIRGAELMKLLALDPDELGSPKVSQQFAHVAKFVSKYDDGLKLMRMAMSKHLSPHIRPLDHVESLVLLRERMIDLEKKAKVAVNEEERQTAVKEYLDTAKEVMAYE